MRLYKYIKRLGFYIVTLLHFLKIKTFSGQKKLIMKQTKLLKNKMRSMKNQSQSPQSNITVQVEVVANPVAQTMIILVGK